MKRHARKTLKHEKKMKGKGKEMKGNGNRNGNEYGRNTKGTRKQYARK